MIKLLNSKKQLAAASQTQKKQPKKQRGQGMTEYIIIVALIGVAAIGVYRLFGDTVRQQMAGLSNELAGQDAGADLKAAKGSAKTARTNSTARKNLGNYNTNNR